MTDVEKNAILGNVQRQYVGARYVPKFFQGPDGTPTWVGNVPYEALTIVTHLGNSYTSKVPVPVGIGNPSENPTYWALTGNYNAQVEAYRQEVEEYKSGVSDLEKTLAHISVFVTPEMFGGIGDGLHDDTDAISAALKSPYPVIGNKNYKISSTLVLDGNKTLIVNGVIIADSCNAVEITGINNTCLLNTVSGSTGYNGIVLKSDDTVEGIITAYNTIRISQISGFDDCLLLHADGNAGIQYNVFYLGYIIANKNAIHIKGSGSAPWVAQNNFYNGRLRGNQGVFFEPSPSQADAFNKNTFYGLGFEGITGTMIVLNFAMSNEFYSPRTSISENPNALQVSIVRSSKNSLINASELNIAKIQDSGTNTNLMFENYFSSNTFLEGSDTFLGKEIYSGGAFYCEKRADQSKNMVSGYGTSTNLKTSLRAPSEGLRYEIGGDANQNLTHTLTNIFTRHASYFFIHCASKNSSCSIKFLNEDGTTAIGDNFTANTNYLAVNVAGSWRLLTFN